MYSYKSIVMGVDNC